MKRRYHGNGGDWSPHGSHALVELVLDLVGTDDGPIGAVVEHFFVGLLRTRRRLKSKAIISSAEGGERRTANGPLHYSYAVADPAHARSGWIEQKHVDRMPP